MFLLAGLAQTFLVLAPIFHQFHLSYLETNHMEQLTQPG